MLGSLTSRISLSLRSIVSILWVPTYASLAVGLTCLALGFLVWVSNYHLLLFLLFQPTILVTTKITFFFGGYLSLFTNYYPVSAIILVIFACLTGLNFTLLIYILSRSYRLAIAGGLKNAGAIAAATLGAGCAACGTSLVSPLILVGLSSIGSIHFAQALRATANSIGILLLIFSIYEAGLAAATLKARQR